MTSEARRPVGSDLPLEVDVDFYRARYEDVAALEPDAAQRHYGQHGRDEGRVATAVAVREHFLDDIVRRVAGEKLEIGPFCNPQLKGPDVRYLDVLDAAGLLARANAIGLDATGCPDTIDYVGGLESVDRRFAAIFSSHTIEHQPDLVDHLRSVARLLDRGGRYFLIVPDKRFCFDALIPESTIAQVVQAYHDKRRVHTLQSVIEHRALTRHNDASRHWVGDHGEIPRREQADRVKRAIMEYDRSGGAYIDVHAWYFTPTSFRSIMAQLLMLDLTGLRPVRVYDTPRDRFEFCAVLEKVRRR